MRPTMNQQNWAKVRQWEMITLCIALFSNISRGKKRFFGKVIVRQIRKSVKSVQLLMVLLCMHSALSISVIVQTEKSKKMSSLLSTKWTICYSLTVKNTRSNKMSKKVCFSGLYFHTNMSMSVWHLLLLMGPQSSTGSKRRGAERNELLVS